MSCLCINWSVCHEGSWIEFGAKTDQIVCNQRYSFFLVLVQEY